MIFLNMEPRVDPRRKQERVDGNMLNEDKTAPSNCPSEVRYHTFNAWKYPERLAMYDQSEPQE